MTLLLALALFATRVPARIEMIATELVANFNAGQFEAASKDFTADMRKVVTPAVMASIKQKLDAEFGKFQSVMRTTEQQEGDVRTVQLLLRYSGGPVSMHLTFDREDRIASVEFNQQTSDGLEATARKFLSNFVAERYDEAAADFSATLREQLTTERLRTLHTQTLTVYGPYDALIEASTRENQGFKIIDLDTRWGKSHAIVSVVFDNDRHIAGLLIAPPR